MSAKPELQIENSKAAPAACEWCDGYGFMRLPDDGKAVKWDSILVTTSVTKCYCRRAR